MKYLTLLGKIGKSFLYIETWKIAKMPYEEVYFQRLKEENPEEYQQMVDKSV